MLKYIKIQQRLIKKCFQAIIWLLEVSCRNKLWNSRSLLDVAFTSDMESLNKENKICLISESRPILTRVGFF